MNCQYSLFKVMFGVLGAAPFVRVLLVGQGGQCPLRRLGQRLKTKTKYLSVDECTLTSVAADSNSMSFRKSSASTNHRPHYSQN